MMKTEGRIKGGGGLCGREEGLRVPEPETPQMDKKGN